MNKGAVARWQKAQRRTLSDAYDRAWGQGVDSYEPDEDPDEGTVPALVAGSALLAARARPYRPPAQLDETAKAKALRPAAEGLQRMADELLALTPTSGHMDQSSAAAIAGDVPMGGVGPYAEALALDDWLSSNASRLDAGESVAWAGEQRGYAEAANADGQLLEWLPEADDRVCADCEGLNEMPPMPLSDWPTTPASGDTACSVGCRCVLQVSDDQTLGPHGEPPALSDDQERLVSEIAARREPSDWAAALA